jgi:hypothetical protein
MIFLVRTVFICSVKTRTSSARWCQYLESWPLPAGARAYQFMLVKFSSFGIMEIDNKVTIASAKIHVIQALPVGSFGSKESGAMLCHSAI